MTWLNFIFISAKETFQMRANLCKGLLWVLVVHPDFNRVTVVETNSWHVSCFITVLYVKRRFPCLFPNFLNFYSNLFFCFCFAGEQHSCYWATRWTNDGRHFFFHSISIPLSWCTYSCESVEVLTWTFLSIPFFPWFGVHQHAVWKSVVQNFTSR
jgi:hypothetical protein